MSGPGWNAAAEATFRIRPERRSSIDGRKRPVRCVSAATLTWIIASCSESDSSAKRPCAPKPASLTRTSTATPRARRSPAIRAGASGSERSAATARARTPYSSERPRAIDSSRSRRRATRTRSFRSRARSWASLSPMPLDAPVTSAVGIRLALRLPGRGAARLGNGFRRGRGGLRDRLRPLHVRPRVRELGLPPPEQPVEEHHPHGAADREADELRAPALVVVAVDAERHLPLRDRRQAPVVEADRVVAHLGAVLEERRHAEALVRP